MLQETDRLLDFEIDVVLAGFRTQANLLQFGVMLFALRVLFTLLVLELAVVHDSANWGFGFRRHFHQVQSRVAGIL